MEFFKEPFVLMLPPKQLKIFMFLDVFSLPTLLHLLFLSVDILVLASRGHHCFADSF